MISGTIGFLLCVYMHLKEFVGGIVETQDFNLRWFKLVHRAPGLRFSLIPNLLLWQVSLLDQMIFWALFPVVLSEQFCSL